MKHINTYIAENAPNLTGEQAKQAAEGMKTAFDKAIAEFKGEKGVFE